MPENKKQHYVPRLYLKRFSDDEKSINLFNLKLGKSIHEPNFKNQCYEDYFYGKDLIVEKFLGKIENNAVNYFKYISSSNELPKRGSELYMDIFLYVILQHGRTKYNVLALNEATDRMVKHIFESNPEIKKKILDKFTNEINEPGRVALRFATEASIITYDLHLKLIVITNEKQEFITSDNPVVLYNQFFEYREKGSNVGLASKGLQIFFPIDSKRMLLFFDSDIYKVGNKKDLIVFVNKEDDINSLNQLQIVNALSNVYYKSKTLNIKKIYTSSISYFRKQKTNLNIFSGVDEKKIKSELLAISDGVVHTKLQLSFVKVIKKAKRWRIDFNKMKMQPIVVVRNDQVIDDLREFREIARSGKYSSGDFSKFLKDKYGFDS